MEIHLDKAIARKPWADDAAEIVRKCVHCGFCTATCPTYQLLGHESDSPRGRIYLIKQLLEGEPANTSTQGHLDRCLTCRSCETTCPSGVKYSQLLDIGRELVDEQVPRRGVKALKRKALTTVLPRADWLAAGVRLSQPVRQWLPKKALSALPADNKNLDWPDARHERKMLLLQGCAQSALTPETNAAAARVLDRLGVSLIAENPKGCCGAVRLHNGEHTSGIADIKKRIDAWWPQVNPDNEQPYEAIISSASGCGVTVKQYGELLKNDPDYAEKAAHIASLCLDLSEAVASELAKNSNEEAQKKPLKVAVHNPCTLQHGQKVLGTVEALLHQAGYETVPVANGHLCCGSAGTYSVLQPEIADQLKTNKLEVLQQHSPDVIVTANIGCQLHLRSDARVPVVHWVELLATEVV